MAKYALLVGVGKFKHEDLEPLPKALLDVAAMRRALLDPDLGAFEEDKIVVCENPGRVELEDSIYDLFHNKQRDDLLLFYFSGHGISDEAGKFYFSTSETRKDDGRLRPTRAVSADIVHGYMDAKSCRSKRMALILDCCHSGAFAKGAKIKGGVKARINEELGGEGRAILTAASATEYAWSKDEYPLSAYTHILLEGVRTGRADRDGNDFLTMDELHAYASERVRDAGLEMTPEFFPMREGAAIKLFRAKVTDPVAKYRQEVEKFLPLGDDKRGEM